MERLGEPTSASRKPIVTRLMLLPAIAFFVLFNPTCFSISGSAGFAASPRGAGASAGQKSADNAESPAARLVEDRFIARENQLSRNVRTYSPRIETYIQNFRPDPELGSVPTDD